MDREISVMRWAVAVLLVMLVGTLAHIQAELIACTCRSDCWSATHARGELLWSRWTLQAIEAAEGPPCQCLDADGDLAQTIPTRLIL